MAVTLSFCVLRYDVEVLVFITDEAHIHDKPFTTNSARGSLAHHRAMKSKLCMSTQQRALDLHVNRGRFSSVLMLDLKDLRI